MYLNISVLCAPINISYTGSETTNSIFTHLLTFHFIFCANDFVILKSRNKTSYFRCALWYQT